jgi:hypothetical protein
MNERQCRSQNQLCVESKPHILKDVCYCDDKTSHIHLDVMVKPIKKHDEAFQIEDKDILVCRNAMSQQYGIK